MKRTLRVCESSESFSAPSRASFKGDERKSFYKGAETDSLESQTRKPPPTPPAAGQPVVVAWYRGDADHLPRPVRELAGPRDGWTPAAWRERLLQLAERCEQTNAARAAELRRAAALMTRDTETDAEV